MTPEPHACCKCRREVDERNGPDEETTVDAKKRTQASGNTVYLVYDRKGRPVWVTVPRK